MKILAQYEQADRFKRLNMFLQFRDLRPGFQEIERKKSKPLKLDPVTNQADLREKGLWIPCSSIEPSS